MSVLTVPKLILPHGNNDAGPHPSPVPVPRPSLWLHPSQGVSLGDTVTLRCHLPRQAARVWLYQDEGWTYSKGKDKEQDVVEFSFVSTKWEKADHSFPPPGISLQSKERVGTGTNVTIHCWNKDYGASFLLHKDGRSAPIQRQDPDGGGTATFTFFGVTPADAGTYRCSYHPKNHPFVSSPLGSSVTLEVTSTPATPGSEEWSRASLVIALLRVLFAALVFSLEVFFAIDARSLWIQRFENCGEEGVKCLPSPIDHPRVPCPPFYPISILPGVPSCPLIPYRFPIELLGHDSRSPITPTCPTPLYDTVAPHNA
ncbi:LOW QUALITY PROTEIN: platelet glycoprotein VI-like [Numida meleagris]|uniref:LOW QUALITY PROTEIN: platelet glycoprotein VI-like n=1 Tax=Numida meleagris TaxID=8996 RepID=UPI000B3E04F9|nr:LOW QUALITY PROTEIN: platelet glycoprotein VI-like [Numida meleagris]